MTGQYPPPEVTIRPYPASRICDVVVAPTRTTVKASASWLFRGYRVASAPTAYASRMVLPPSMQGSLPAGWLAFTGRELNPLDRDEGFQITSSFSLPGLFLAQHPKTCTGRDSCTAANWRRSAGEMGVADYLWPRQYDLELSEQPGLGLDVDAAMVVRLSSGQDLSITSCVLA